MTTKFNRSSFKTTKSLAEQEQELASKIKSNNFANTPGRIELKDDGEYLLRFWPVHPGVDSYFMLPRMVHFLEIEGDKYDDKGNIVKNGDIPEREVKKRTVPNARIHGNLPNDIVEEYIAFANKMADETYPATKEGKEKKKEFLKSVYGYNKGNTYVGGINGTLDYVAYASLLIKQADGSYKEKEFGLVSLKSSVRKGMLKLSANGNDEEGIVTDPFTDPDNGFIVRIIKDSVAGKADPANYYSVSFLSKSYVPVKWPLPDGFEKKYEEMKSLSEMYEGTYKTKHFQDALDGLQRFDAANKFNIFNYDEFLDTVEKIQLLLPEAEPETEETSSSQQEPEQAPAPVTPRAVTTPKVEAVVEAVPAEEKSDLPFDKPDSGSDRLRAMRERASGKK